MPTAAAAAPAPEQPTAKTPKPANDSKKQPEDVKAKVAALSAIVLDHRRACRCGACVSLLAAEAGEPDALDQVEALFAVALDDWEEMAKPIVQPIADIITSAASFEEALRLIETAGPDASKMAERLGRLTAIARGVGDIAD